MEGIKKLIRDGEGMGMLEAKLGQLLGDLPDDDSCWDLLPRFIDFLQQYEGQVKGGYAVERIMVAGLYEATEKVREINWGRMKEIIKRIKEVRTLVPPEGSE